MAARFNSPPNWPAPPPGWTPPSGWQPDPAWGPPPAGWQLWADDEASPAHAGAPQGAATTTSREGWYKRGWAIAGAAILVLFIIAASSDDVEVTNPKQTLFLQA